MRIVVKMFGGKQVRAGGGQWGEDQRKTERSIAAREITAGIRIIRPWMILVIRNHMVVDGKHESTWSGCRGLAMRVV